MARRSDCGSIATSTVGSGMPGVGWKVGLPAAKPEEGRSRPFGGWKRNGSPDGVVIVSVSGLKVVLPA